MPDIQTFDEDALRRKLGGDEDFIGGLLAIALRTTAPLPADLRTACRAVDFAALARIAHRIKGTAGDVVAASLQERARLAELAARESRPEAMALGLRLAEEADAFVRELERRVGPG